MASEGREVHWRLQGSLWNPPRFVQEAGVVADIQDLPKLAMDILSLARLVQKMPWPAKMVLVNCPLPAWVAASFPQGWGKVLGCSQQAAMAAKVAKSSSWEPSGGVAAAL